MGSSRKVLVETCALRVKASGSLYRFCVKKHATDARGLFAPLPSPHPSCVELGHDWTVALRRVRAGGRWLPLENSGQGKFKTKQ